MKSIRFFIIALAVFASIFNCNETNRASPHVSKRSIIFLDSALLYNPPVLAMLIVENDSLKMDSIQFPNMRGYWDAAIAPSENDSLWRIIDNNNLVGSPSPVCQSLTFGYGDSRIIFKRDFLFDTIIVHSLFHDPQCWSNGLRSLIAYKDSIVKKYQR